MHYLIQKTTRQHIAVADDMPCPVECVKVRANKDGWVVYHDVVCPVPRNSRVDICTMDGKVFAAMPAWDVKWPRVSDYRPECDTISTAFERLHEAGRTLAGSAESAVGLDRFMARAGETDDDLPADTEPGHETAAMLLSILCAFALGALIGWGWM